MSAPRPASALSFPILPLLQASPVSDVTVVPSLKLLSYSAPVLLPSLAVPLFPVLLPSSAVPLFSVLLFQSFVPSLAVRSEPLSSLRSLVHPGHMDPVHLLLPLLLMSHLYDPCPDYQRPDRLLFPIPSSMTFRFPPDRFQFLPVRSNSGIPYAAFQIRKSLWNPVHFHHTRMPW